MSKFDMRLVQAFGKKYQAQLGAKRTAKPVDGDICKGERNSTLASIGGSLRRRGLDQGAILETLLGVNRSKCKPSLSDREVEKIASSIARYAPVVKDSHCNNINNRQLVVVKASDVEPEEIQWLWHERLALGKLSLMVGNPGQGKSYASCALAAAITRGGKLPSHEGDVVQGDVLMFAVEDGIADTIRPRLDIVEANASKVHIVPGKKENGKDKHISLETDLDLIEEHLRKGNYKLIILDPVNAYLGGSIDSYKDSEIRSVLSPVALMAERHNVAIICIMHLNKSQGANVIYRILGSIGYVGVARTVLFVGEHPVNYQERIIDCVKTNIGNTPVPIAFELDNGKFLWIGETDVGANDVLNAQGGEAKSALNDAEHFLREELSDGTRKQKEISKAAEDANISKRTLERAKTKLKVESRFVRLDKQRYWVWELPNNPKNASGEQLAILPPETQKGDTPQAQYSPYPE